MKKILASLVAPALALMLGACDSSAENGAAGTYLPGAPIETPPSANPPAKNGPVATRKFATDFLVFTGDGTWSTEITDVEALMTANGATFQEADLAQLDAMTAEQMADFGVIYIPGGEGGTEAGSVSAATTPTCARPSSSSA